MQRRLVLSIPIHTLENINFTLVRPTIPAAPKRRPGSAAVGHVDSIEDDETAVHDVVRVDAHRFAVAGDLGCRFDAHDGIACRIDRNEPGVFGSGSSLVVDGTIGDIRLGIEQPIVEKVLA